MKDVFQKGLKTIEIKNEIDEIKKWEERIRWKELCKTNKNKYDLQQSEAKKSFGDSIYNGKISIDEADIDRSSLLNGLKDYQQIALAQVKAGNTS